MILLLEILTHWKHSCSKRAVLKWSKWWKWEQSLVSALSSDLWAVPACTGSVFMWRRAYASGHLELRQTICRMASDTTCWALIDSCGLLGWALSPALWHDSRPDLHRVVSNQPACPLRRALGSQGSHKKDCSFFHWCSKWTCEAWLYTFIHSTSPVYKCIPVKKTSLISFPNL